MIKLKSFRVEPGSSVHLDRIDPRDTRGTGDEAGREFVRTNVDRLAEQTELLWAGGQRSLLIVLQGMDTSGKDGTIRHVMSGIDPTVCRVESFKRPTDEELAHDFLWRVHARTPRRGQIVVFNRSHYEDVLVARVRELVPESVWRTRYERINEFERMLADSGTVIVKFFLHISKSEQKERLASRLRDPSKNWKFEPGDLEERKRWDDYQEAYEAAIERCSTEWAPWYIVPSDRKWFRNLVVSAVISETLEKLEMRWPAPKFDAANYRVE